MRSLTVLPIIAICVFPWRADAGEDELVMAVEGGYSLLDAPENSRHGAEAHLSVWVGLTESIWLAGSGGLSNHFQRRALGEQRMWEAFGGLVAAFDVLRTIPFLEALIGIVGSSGGALSPTFRAGVGADYLLSPSLSAGGVARYRPLPSHLGEGTLSIELRIGYRLDL